MSTPGAADPGYCCPIGQRIQVCLNNSRGILPYPVAFITVSRRPISLLKARQRLDCYHVKLFMQFSDSILLKL